MASATSGDSQSLPPKKPAKMKDPERIEMIKTHRMLQKTLPALPYTSVLPLEDPGLLSGNQSKETGAKPKFLDKVPKNLKPIKLRQMDPEQEWIYTKRVLYLTLIEDPMLGFTPIHFIAEDENGDATRLFIHEIPHNRKMCEIFCFEQQVAIINPYMRIAMDGRHGIRVDDPETIIVLGKKVDVCRYCGKQNAPHKCGKCKRASYCSRECQVSDWKDLDHKHICRKQK